MRLPLPKLPCAGILCHAGQDYQKPLQTFHATCLHCRIRRRFYKKYVNPPYWINYTYLSWYGAGLCDLAIINGVTYYAPKGQKLIHRYTRTLKIDPRGKFLRYRLACIVLIDKLMLRFGVKKYQKGQLVERNMRKPFPELCEFLANYP